MWIFKVATSSPQYHQSNDLDLVERELVIAKKMLSSKSYQQKHDLELYLLNYIMRM